MPDSLLKKRKYNCVMWFYKHISKWSAHLSMNSTWVKGKCPTFPLSSPSHWPLMLILVTLTMSPTCKETIGTFRASLDNQLSFTDLQSESSFVVSIGNSTLFDSSVGWQGSLGNTSVRTYCVRIVEETVDAYLYIWMPRLGTILCVVIWRTILMVLCSFVNLEMMEINLKIELFCFHRKSLKTQPKRQVSCFYRRLLQISTKNA